MSTHDSNSNEETFSQSWNGQTVFRIFKLGLKQWRLMSCFIVAIMTVSILEAWLTFLTGRMVDAVALTRDISLLNRLALTYGSIFILFALGRYIFIMATGYFSCNVSYDLRNQLFDHMQKMELAYYNRTPSGSIQSRLTSDVGRVTQLLSWGFLDMTWAVTNIIASIIFMAVINWRLMLVVMLMVPALIVVAIYFKNLILVEYRKSRRVNSQITTVFSEGIMGVRVIKALGREETNLGQFQQLTDTMYDASFKAAWLSKLFLPSVLLIGTATLAAIVWIGGWQVTMGVMTIGGIQAFVGYVLFMLWPIQDMATVYSSMQQAIASAERIFSLLDMEPGLVEQPGAITADSLRGDIIFDDVMFAYEENVPVLSGFNLHVREGETIALVGPTGAGKTTVTNLVGRFYEPTGGTITIAGHKYRDLTLDTIQSKLGVVLQTTHLFSGTVMENIRYGRLDATDDEVIDAATIAGAHHFISELDGEYEAMVGEDGVLLSTGQKQLLSISRAILADPDIFIMDEATSAVDTLTEHLIQQGLDRVLNGRTSFVIAHRLSTIRNADRILVIDDGRITEMGSHDDLMDQRGHYYDLYANLAPV